MNDDLHDHGLGDLSAQLDTAASHVRAEADIDDLRRRVRHHRRVRGTAMAAILAVTAVAGVAIWQGGDQPVSVATSPQASTSRPAGDGAAATRTTAEGLRVAVSTTTAYGPMVAATPWWTPPESCGPDTWPVVSVIDPARGTTEVRSSPTLALDQEKEPVSVDATLLYVGAPMQGEVASSSGLTSSTVQGAGLGVVIDGPGVDGAVLSGDLPEPDAWVAAVMVAGDHVRHAEVTFVNGTVDEADAVDGKVGLAARYPGGPTHLVAGVVSRLEVTLDHGDPIVATDLSNSHAGFDRAGRLVTVGGPTVTTTPVSPECTPPPPPLPGPGEQPADVDAARAAATATVATFMDGSKPEAEREAAMLDPALGQRVEQELGAGYAAAMTSARTTVTDVVFVSPTTAIVRYDLDVTTTGNEPLPVPTGMFHDSIAKVVLQDGRWLVTPQSLCKITSAATPNACAGMTSAYPDEVYGPGGSAT